MNGAHTAILLFLHAKLVAALPSSLGFQPPRQRPITPNRKPQERPLALRLSCPRCALDRDKVDRTTRPVIVENSDRQPSRPPGERVQVGTALVQQRAFGIVIMAMDNVKIRKASGISCGIALP